MDDLSKPKTRVLDTVNTGAKVVLSLIPGVGGLAAEVFSALITPPIEKRRDQWIESIGNRLIEVEEKFESFSIQELSENELFISVLMQASKVVISNHQEAKINSLRNAVLNAACSKSIDDDKQLTFIKFIDDFTDQQSINAINFSLNNNSGTTNLGREFIDFITSPINN